MASHLMKWSTAAVLLSGISGVAWAQAVETVQVSAERLKDAEALMDQYDEGRILVFDMTQESDKNEKKALMSEISGMVVGDNKQVFVKKGSQGSRFLVLEPDATAASRERALERFNSEQPAP